MNKIKKRPVFRLCNDSVFKEIFSKVPNALILLISDVLNIEYETIKTNSTVELASELHKNRDANKTTICDFVVKVNDYLWVNVEMNKNFYKGLTERNLLYASRILSNNIPGGTNYNEIPKYKVAQLNINCFRNNNGKILAKMMLIDTDTGIIATEALFFYNFDIEKCFHLYYNIDEENIDAKSRLIKWGTILYTTDISSIDKIMGDDFMNKEDKEKFIKVSEELQERHRTFTDEEIIQLTEYKFEEQRLAAIEEGLQEGLQQGIEQGMEQKTIEYTKEMLKQNLDIQLISKITGLSKEEIMKIKEQSN